MVFYKLHNVLLNNLRTIHLILVHSYDIPGW